MPGDAALLNVDCLTLDFWNAGPFWLEIDNRPNIPVDVHVHIFSMGMTFAFAVELKEEFAHCQEKGGQVCMLQSAQANAVALPADPEHSSLIEALEPYRKNRVLHFPDMRHAYGSFPSKEYRKR